MSMAPSRSRDLCNVKLDLWSYPLAYLRMEETGVLKDDYIIHEWGAFGRFAKM